MGGQTVAIQGIQISSLVETIIKGQSFLSFDVSLSGHLISTIRVRHQSGIFVWSEARAYGFEDFDRSDYQAIEQQIRASWACRARQAQIH